MNRLNHTLHDLALEWSRRAMVLVASLAWMLASASTQAAGEQVLKLRNPEQATTEYGRQLVKYLVSCALPEGVTVEVTVEGKPYSFPGGMGLAPAWAQRDLNEPEQRLISACILARTNYFGKKVQLSLRSDQPNLPPSLIADEAELRDYSFHEGAFFGNLFQPGSPAYVCQGKTADQEREQVMEGVLRICSLNNRKGLPGQFSNCGFIIVGECNPGSYLQGGVDYSHEAIHTYLKPVPQL